MSAVPTHHPPGYQLLEKLGEGAAGMVFKARQESTGQLVAIKLMRVGPELDLVARERLTQRFSQETQLCAQLHHPHIVRLFDKGKTQAGDLFAAFEFVPGETLRDLLLRQGVLSPPQAGELLGQVLDALAAAHAQNIVHRDLKPLNIMVSRSGAKQQAKVLDFGIGALVAGRAEASMALAQTADILGTPRYCAPEQLRGEPPTLKSDLYAWGLILLECLTGMPAIRGSTLAQIYHEHLSPTPIAIPEGLSKHPVGDMLQRVLNKDPHRRGEAQDWVERFHQINWHSIVGPLGVSAVGVYTPDNGMTHAKAAAPIERRQITMLCYSVSCNAQEGSEPDADLWDELLQDLLMECQRICVGFSAQTAGSLGHARLMYFGYPQSSDAAARQAACAALELVQQVAQRSRRLQKRDAMRLEARVALHTGMVMVYPGQTPGGQTAEMVRRLEALTPAGHITLSQETQRLLARHFLFKPVDVLLTDFAGRTVPVGVLVEERRNSRSANSAAGAHEQLLGREAELSLLQELWRQTQQAVQVANLMLVGEPGIGKSRLVQALSERVTSAGSKVWVLACLPEQRNAALWPFLRWMRTCLGLDGAEDGAAATLALRTALAHLGLDAAELVPIFCSWLSLPMPEDLTAMPHAPQRQKQIVLETLLTLLQRLALGPALLVVEDVHWLDPTSKELLQHLLKRPGTQALGLVLTARPEGDYHLALRCLTLRGLSPANAQALVRATPGGERLNETELAQLLVRADGNPLYLTELVRAGGEAPAVAAVGEQAKPGTTFGAALSVPITLRDLLSQALDRLGPAKETAQQAAVLGREFDYHLLAATVMRDEAALREDLQEMLKSELIQRQRRVQGDSFSFRHALIRDAAYEAMPALLREQAHARVALRLKEGGGDDSAAALTHHFAKARRFELAVDYGTQAASQALSRALPDEALSHAEAVQSWLPWLPEPAQARAELAINMVMTQALMSKFGWADARVRACAERARQLLDQVEDDERAGAVLWMLATYHHVASDRARVRELAQQLLALAQRCGHQALLRAAYAIQGIAHWIDGRPGEAVASLEQVLALPVAQGNEDSTRFGLDCRCWAMAALAQARWFAYADAAAAHQLVQQAVDEAERLGHMPTLGVALMYQAIIHQYQQEREAVARVCERLLALSRRYGLPAVEGYAAILEAWTRDDATTIETALSVLQAMGCSLASTYLRSLAAEVLMRQHQQPQALACVEQALQQAQRIQERYFEPALQRQKAAYSA